MLARLGCEGTRALVVSAATEAESGGDAAHVAKVTDVPQGMVVQMVATRVMRREHVRLRTTFQGSVMPSNALPARPNILILLCDQQRSIQHFPETFVRDQLPVLNDLMATGVTFGNGITNVSPCSPSRATLLTSCFPSETGVTQVINKPGSTDLSPTVWGQRSLGYLLQRAGYDVVYKGKWHLTGYFTRSAQVRPVDPFLAERENAYMRDNFYWDGWTSPDVGTEEVPQAKGDPVPTLTCPPPGSPPSQPQDVFTLAEGPCYNDRRITDSAVQWLRERVSTPNEKPFCLVVSLVNPHDVSLYPTGYAAAGYKLEDFTGEAYKDFVSPPNRQIAEETRPRGQRTYRKENDTPPLTGEDALNYLRFYAYLQTRTDRYFGEVVEALGALRQDTLIVRVSDHGEMATSQGGLEQKDVNAYRETLNVPLIFSHPSLPQGVCVPQLAGLVDVLPTLVAIAGASTEHATFRGIDLTPTLLDTTQPTQPEVLFTFDGESDPESHIRCILTDEWKYVVYYSVPPGQGPQPLDLKSLEYELYHVARDVYEIENLLPANAPPSAEATRVQAHLHARLTALMQTKHATPLGWPASIPT